MSPAESKSPFETIIEDIKNNTLDPDQRMIVAKGFLPLDPETLATALLYLTRDDDENICNAAKDTILEMPVNIIKNIAKNRNTPPDLYQVLAKLRIGDEELLETMVLNPNISDETFEYIGRYGPAKVVEILAGNQERMLNRESIIVAILENKTTPQFIRMKLEMFRSELHEQREARLDNKRKSSQSKEKIAEAPPIKKTVVKPVIEKKRPVVIKKEVVIKKKVEVEDENVEYDEEIDLFEEDEDEYEEEEETGRITTSQRIQGMLVADKIKLATLGSREERMILLRETNKLVASAAIKSPKVTEEEIEQIAKMKNVIDEVLREIGNNREYTKNPNIRRSLLANPRTPIAISLNLLKFVQDRELNDLSKNKNIPEVIRTSAKRIMIQKEKRKQSKKH